MIPLDDHVRRWRIATDPNFLADVMADAIIKHSAYRWQRIQYAASVPKRRPDLFDRRNTRVQDRRL